MQVSQISKKKKHLISKRLWNISSVCYAFYVFIFCFQEFKSIYLYTNIIHIYSCILELALLLLHFTLLHCLWHAILSYLWLVLLAYNKWNLSSFIAAGLRDSGWCGVPLCLFSGENISCPFHHLPGISNQVPVCTYKMRKIFHIFI